MFVPGRVWGVDSELFEARAWCRYWVQGGLRSGVCEDGCGNYFE